MTDRAQFEAMLEALINEDQETAKEIFHNIVVGKSREIYEELLESDFPGSEEEEEEDSFPGSEEEEEEEEEDSDDESDSENPFDDESDDEEGEEDGDLEDRVLDLEDALEELKAEFEQLLAGEENEPEHADMFGGEEDEMGDEDEFGADLGADDSEVKEIVHHHVIHEEPQDEMEAFLEYVNKVALPKHGDNGVQTKSVVDNMKNNMGGKVIGRSSDETKGGTQGGLLNPATKPQTGGNVNVPGAKSATKLSPVSKGHGAEKKGTGEKSVNDKGLIKGK